jgi:hypothetical protein
VAQEVEPLPSKCKALNAVPSAKEKEREKEGREGKLLKSAIGFVYQLIVAVVLLLE